MVKPCVFSRLGVNPECCESGLCTAENSQYVEQCCGKVGLEVPPQALLEAYLESLKPGALAGVAIVLLSTIGDVEAEQNIRLL